MGILFFPNYELALKSGHTILPEHTIESSKRAYYFSPTLIWPQQVGILFFQNSWLKQAGTLFFPYYQLAQASGHIFPILPNGSSKRAYYFSPTTNWLKQAGILFAPTTKWLNQAGLLFFSNYQLAPASGHIIFPHSIGSSKRAYFSKTLNWLQEAGIFFPITNWLQQACI